MSDIVPEDSNKIEVGNKPINKGGRPNVAEQVEHRIKALIAFKKFKSPETASLEIGLSLTTVKGLYRRFGAYRLYQSEKEFIDECRINKSSYVYFIDDLLSRLYIVRDNLEVNLKKMFESASQGGEIDYELIKSYLDVINVIAKVGKHKLDVVNSPTVDLSLIRFVKEVRDLTAA